MMQFTKTNLKIKSITIVIVTLLVILRPASNSAANTQFDAKVSDLKGQNGVESKKFNKSIINPDINVQGYYNLTPDLFLMLNDRCDVIRPFKYGRDTSTGKLNPISERYVLSNNNAGLGLRFTGLGISELSLKNTLYLDTMSIKSNRIPYAYDYPQDRLTLDSIASGNIWYSHSQIRNMRTNANFFWSLPLGHFDLKADVNYFILNFSDISKYNNFINNDSLIVKHNVTDINQVLNLSICYNLPLDLNVETDAFLNQDLSGYSYTNLYQYYLFAGGTHSFPLDNKLTWKAGSEWYLRASESSMPEMYSSDLKSEAMIPPHAWWHLYLRDVYTLAWGFFLKATAIADLGEDLFKQRYEIELRKAWENSSSIDAGYYAAINGLFPMQGTYLRLRFFPTPNLELSGATKFLWEQTRTFNDMGEFTGYKYFYLKNITSGELAVKVSDKISMYGGFDFTYFNKIQNIEEVYPSRFALFAGIRGVL